MTAEQLKKSIIQEAIQGKLVPQSANEGTGKELLEKILKEKAQLILDKKIKKEKSLEPIKEDEIPFEIPNTWSWCRLGEICDKLVDGDHNPPAGCNKVTEYLMLSSRNINNDRLENLENLRYLTKDVFDKEHERTLATEGDIFFTSVGTLGRSCIYSGELNVCFQRSVSVLHTLIYNRYLKYYFDSPYYQYYVIEHSSGTAQKGFYLKEMANSIIALPSLAEQQRIVDAIEKFMPLVDEYGKREIKLNSLNEVIGEKTKKAILQEAISGVLTEGWRKNNKVSETGKDLLEKILKEKAELIKEGKTKKEKPLEPINEEEIPFDIPESWCWCNVGDLFTTMSGLGYKKDLLAEKSENMIRVLRGGNIQDTSYVFKDDDIMISSAYVKKELLLKTNYLITPAVTSLEHIGKIARIEQDYEDTVVGGFVLMIKPYLNNETLSKYCLYLFSSHWFRCLCKEITHKSGQAFYNLSRDKLINISIPLPPLEEQKQIIKIIEALLPLCEKLGK